MAPQNSFFYVKITKCRLHCHIFELFFFPFRLEISTLVIIDHNRPQRPFTEVVLEKCTFESSILKSMHSCYIIISPTWHLEQWKQEYWLITLLTLKAAIVTLQTFGYPSTPYWRKDNTRHKSWNMHLCDFPLPQCWFGYYSRLSAPKYSWLNIGEGKEHI